MISKKRHPKLHISSFSSNLWVKMNSGDLKSKGVKTFSGGSAMKNANYSLTFCLKIIWCRSKVTDDEYHKVVYLPLPISDNLTVKPGSMIT